MTNNILHEKAILHPYSREASNGSRATCVDVTVRVACKRHPCATSNRVSLFSSIFSTSVPPIATYSIPQSFPPFVGSRCLLQVRRVTRKLPVVAYVSPLQVSIDGESSYVNTRRNEKR